MRIATDIKWDVDIEDVIEKIDNMTAENAAEALDIPYQVFVNMNTSEVHDYVYDMFKYSSSIAADIVGLPEEVEIPDEVGDDDIEDYLSDETGYLIKSYSVAESKFLS